MTGEFQKLTIPAGGVRPLAVERHPAGIAIFWAHKSAVSGAPRLNAGHLSFHHRLSSLVGQPPNVSGSKRGVTGATRRDAGGRTRHFFAINAVP
jgi:hypothetical protein